MKVCIVVLFASLALSNGEYQECNGSNESNESNECNWSIENEPIKRQEPDYNPPEEESNEEVGPNFGTGGDRGFTCNEFPPLECKEQTCYGGMDPKGCPMPDSCLPFKNGGCAEHCPVNCAANEIMCSYGSDPTTDCHLGDFCHPAKSGNFALDGKTECAEHCPVNCGQDEMFCQGGQGADGCAMPDLCIPNKGPMGKDDIPCPANCPTVCGPEEIECSNGVDPTSGCPMGSGCQLIKDGCPTV